jgi:hypothetical protein
VARDRDAEAARLLLSAAATIAPASSGTEAWDYGWCSADYRNSGSAAMSSSDGPVSLTSEGIRAFEAAMELLLGLEAVRARWDADELWSVVASLMLFVRSTNADPLQSARQIRRLRTAGPALVVFPVSNVSWCGAPMEFKDAAIGLAENVAGSIAGLSKQDKGRVSAAVGDYLRDRLPHGPQTVVFGCVTAGQATLAFAEGEHRFRRLVDLALLLELDPEGKGVFSLRGAANRPGIRGVDLDRIGIEKVVSERAAHELFVSPLVVDLLGGEHISWGGASPFPLEALLMQRELSRDVGECLSGIGPVFERLAVCARWYSEAHWADAKDDAVLALGVALDALIGSKEGLPGRVMAERFALLEPSPNRRAERAQRYHELFGVRSAVAHGGRSKSADDHRFVRAFAAEVTWAAARLLAFEQTFRPAGASGFETTFADLGWGTRHW